MIFGFILGMFMVGLAPAFFLYTRAENGDLGLIDLAGLGSGLSLVLVVLTGFLLGVNDQVADFWLLLTGSKGISRTNLWLILSVSILVLGLLYLNRHNNLRLSKIINWFRGFYKRKSLREVLSITFKRVKANSLLVLVIAFAILIKAYPLYYFNNFAESESAKAIFWAKQIMTTHAIPDYQKVPSGFSDVDFDTPGLHIFVASIGLLSDSPLVSIVGVITVIESLAASFLIYSVAFKLTGNKAISTLTLLFFSAALPFMRYTNLPGYHFQNLFGEVLIFLTIYLILHILDGKNLGISISLFSLSLFSLLTVHKLSAYSMLFLLVVMLFPIMALRGRKTLNLVTRHVIVTVSSLVLILLLVFYTLLTIMRPTLNAFLYGGVGRIGLTPSYLQSPSLNDYINTFGAYYVLLSFTGVLICAFYSVKAKEKRFYNIFLLAWFLGVLTMSQGPNLYLYIAPWRSMYYLSAPFAILASIGVCTILAASSKQVRRFISLKAWPKYLGICILLMVLLASCFATSLAIFASYDSLVKTIEFGENSPRSGMMNSEVHDILRWLEHNTQLDDRILVDYWGSSRLEWMFASGRFISFRVGPFIRSYLQDYLRSPHLEERQSLYVHELNFEKIFMMGNSKIAAYLFDNYDFKYLVANRTSETAFSNNTYFSQVYRTANYIVYEFPNTPSPILDSNETIVAKPDTLANKLGDQNDFLESSEAYINSSSRWRIIYLNGTNARVNNKGAAYISFNLEDYVQEIWDENDDGIPDENLTFMMRVYDNHFQFSFYTRNGSEWYLGAIPSTLKGNGSGAWKVVSFRIDSRLVTIDAGKISFLMQVDDRKGPVMIDWIALKFEKLTL